MSEFIRDIWREEKVITIIIILFIGFGIFIVYYQVSHDCKCLKYGNPTYQQIGNILVPMDNCIEMKCKD